MNIALVKRDSKMLIYGLPTVIILFATAFTFTKFPAAYPELAIGITIDLTLTAPLLFLFLIRKTNIPKLFAATFFGVGILVASYGIPPADQFLLNHIQYWVMPAIELVALVFIGHSAYRAVRLFKTERNQNPDIRQVLEETTEKILGQNVLARFAAFEATVFYYAFLSWKKPVRNIRQFTYHKKSGSIVTYGSFAFVIVAETIVIHVLAAEWSEIAAWVFTLSSLYVLVLILAHSKAMFRRPIEVTNEKILVRYGIFAETEIEFTNIESIETGSGFSEDENGLKKIAIFEQCNTKIKLKDEATAFGFYRFKSKYKTILLCVDESEKLEKLIEKHVSN